MCSFLHRICWSRLGSYGTNSQNLDAMTRARDICRPVRAGCTINMLSEIWPLGRPRVHGPLPSRLWMDIGIRQSHASSAQTSACDVRERRATVRLPDPRTPYHRALRSSQKLQRSFRCDLKYAFFHFLFFVLCFGGAAELCDSFSCLIFLFV